MKSLIVARPSRCGSRRPVLHILPTIMVVCGLLTLPVQAQFAQQGPKLVGTDNLGYYLDGQGYSVSLSGDGNTAIVGAPFSFSRATYSGGVAWVLTRSGGIWSQQQEL